MRRKHARTKQFRDVEPSKLVRAVRVVGPWSPWPRDSHDGTCIWPGSGASGPKPPEWWAELWKITEKLGGLVPRQGSFLEGYCPDPKWRVE
jgi:hypothetical protein